MKHTQIILTDTHFGVKSNSVTWLNSQMRFIYDQLIPYIEKSRKSCDKLSLYHLGDVFDSRSSINTFVFHSAEKALNDMIDLCDDAVIIGGNHDYYSPNESEYNVNSIDLLRLRSKCSVLSNESAVIDGIGFMPWFEFHNTDKLREFTESEQPSVLCTHTDLAHLYDGADSILGSIPVLSGHIHTPYSKNARHNLGSCYGLTFSDANQERGFYVIHDSDPATIEFVANTESIKFYRLYSKEDLKRDFRDNDCVQIYTDSTEYDANADLIRKINEKCNCSVIITPNKTDSQECTISEDFDIIDICRQHIPEHLVEKFDSIASKLRQTH